MARRIIIGEILNLIKGLGGNPNKFMGTKTNINFLGKGPKGTLFQGQVDARGMADAQFPIEQIITEAETAGGYAVANKLNDFQLQRLRNNLIEIKKLYAPDPMPNITDLGTGTGGLTQEGLGSLRTKQLFGEHFPGRSTEAGAGFKKVVDDIGGGEETILPLTTRISDRMKKIKELSDEMGRIGKGEPTREMTYTVLDPTAEKVSYASRFNPKNEVHVNKAEALLKDPQIKGVYTEAEVKNAYDFEGLYQSHFDKGHVDVAVLLEQAGHNIPQMRASARSALMDLMKKEKGLPGAESGLRDFVNEVDFKYITEGGGGRAGDPINLMTKYFGKNATESLPKTSTKENIDAFTDFIMAARDSRGRGINDPFFDRESINFSEFTVKRPYGLGTDDVPFKTGGRVGFRLGGTGLLTRGIRNAFKRATKGYDSPYADMTTLTDDASYLMSPVNMQKIKKLEIYRTQLVRDILRNEGRVGKKYNPEMPGVLKIDSNNPKPEATRADLQLLDDYIAKLKNKIKEVGYYGEGAAKEKALVGSRPDLPFPKFIRDKFKHADGGRAGLADILSMNTGGRVGFKWGSGLSKALLRKINKKMVKEAVDDIFPTGDYKMDAELASAALVELNPKLFGGKLIDDLDDAARSDV